VRSGDRTALPRAITLVESTRADHREQAQCLLLELMPDAGKAIQVGITWCAGGRQVHLDRSAPACRVSPVAPPVSGHLFPSFEEWSVT